MKQMRKEIINILDVYKRQISMCAAYKAVKCGYQAAIMAPTAILATQHRCV